MGSEGSALPPCSMSLVTTVSMAMIIVTIAIVLMIMMTFTKTLVNYMTKVFLKVVTRQGYAWNDHSMVVPPHCPNLAKHSRQLTYKVSLYMLHL